MPSSPNPLPANGDWPARYTLWIRGQLDPGWSEWFQGLVVTPTPYGETSLTGTIADQAALHGLLERIRDLNLTLMGVRRLGPDDLSGGRYGTDA